MRLPTIRSASFTRISPDSTLKHGASHLVLMAFFLGRPPGNGRKRRPMSFSMLLIRLSLATAAVAASAFERLVEFRHAGMISGLPLMSTEHVVTVPADRADRVRRIQADKVPGTLSGYQRKGRKSRRSSLPSVGSLW